MIADIIIVFGYHWLILDQKNQLILTVGNPNSNPNHLKLIEVMYY